MGGAKQSRYTDLELQACNILELSGADCCILYGWMKSSGNNVRLHTMETQHNRNFNCFLQCHIPVVAEKIRLITPNIISKPFSGHSVKMLWCWMFYSHLSSISSQTRFPVWSTFVPIWGNIQSRQNGWTTESAKAGHTRARYDKVLTYHSRFSTSDIQKKNESGLQ